MPDPIQIIAWSPSTVQYQMREVMPNDGPILGSGKVFVDTVNGNDNSALRNQPSYPCKTLAQAKLIALANDWVTVRPGNYNEIDWLKTNVHWLFENGANVNYSVLLDSGTVGPLVMFNDHGSPIVTKIRGNADFSMDINEADTGLGGNTIAHLFAITANSTIDIQGNSVSISGGLDSGDVGTGGMTNGLVILNLSSGSFEVNGGIAYVNYFTSGSLTSTAGTTYYHDPNSQFMNISGGTVYSTNQYLDSVALSGGILRANATHIRQITQSGASSLNCTCGLLNKYTNTATSGESQLRVNRYKDPSRSDGGIIVNCTAGTKVIFHGGYLESAEPQPVSLFSGTITWFSPRIKVTTPGPIGNVALNAAVKVGVGSGLKLKLVDPMISVVASDQSAIGILDEIATGSQVQIFNGFLVGGSAWYSVDAEHAFTIESYGRLTYSIGFGPFTSFSGTGQRQLDAALTLP